MSGESFDEDRGLVTMLRVVHLSRASLLGEKRDMDVHGAIIE